MTRDSSSFRGSITTHEAPPPSWHTLERRPPVALKVIHSADTSRIDHEVPLGDDVVLVGRDVQSGGISLSDGQLSRIHFRIGFDHRAGTHRVGDGPSRNGTFLDGTRIDSALLRPGSVLRAGESVFAYGDPEPWASVTERIERLAPTDLAVLITGETGSGKERLAGALHDLSGRSGAFVAVNCAAFSRELLAAELFGHTRGAFSGATAMRPGLFQAADGGTLFLDEIGDLPLELQPVLLRTLQEGTVRSLGADHEQRVDVRVVAATHGNLDDAVAAEKFRPDLYSRLARAVVRVPALRERRASILSLARSLGAARGAAPLQLTANAAEALARHDWPYNVRELQSLIQTFVATCPNVPLEFGYLRSQHPALCGAFRDEEEGGARPTIPPPGRDRASLEMLLTKHGGNVSGIAEVLGKPRAQIYRWLRGAGLDPDRYRGKP